MPGIYDVTAAFEDLLEPVTIYHASGTYINGIWEESATSTLIQAVVQPAKEGELLKLDLTVPTNSEAISIWTKNPLSTGDSTDYKKNDTLTFDGKEYNLLTVKNWERIGGFYKALAILDKGN